VQDGGIAREIVGRSGASGASGATRPRQRSAVRSRKAPDRT
jgi:hypothetical protein